MQTQTGSSTKGFVKTAKWLEEKQNGVLISIRLDFASARLLLGR
jgi:hypothetical protein